MTTIPTIDWTEPLTGEMLLFGLLGRAFQSFPDGSQRDWLQTLLDEDVFYEAPFAASQPDMLEGLLLLQEWSRSGLSNQTIGELQDDYTRLFVGPGKVIAPPWESVQLGKERLTFQEQTLEVRGWYRRFGLQSEKLYHEPDDHIGLEMAFLAHLAQRGLLSIEQGNQAELEQSLQAQREFIEQHLGKWAPAFCEEVFQKAATPFYRGLALLARGALTELGETLKV